MNYEFDYGKLRGKIREVFFTQSTFAHEIGLSSATVSAKLNGRVQFTQEEMKRISGALSIPPNEIHDYFFAPKIQKN